MEKETCKNKINVNKSKLKLLISLNLIIQDTMFLVKTRQSF